MLKSTSKYFGGIAKIHEFENGYGASVICHNGSYGGPYVEGANNFWEVAVLDAEDEITYHTPITQDVIGNQTEEQVNKILKEISELPSEIEHQLELDYAAAQYRFDDDNLEEEIC